jgi:hypothetical protein
VFVEYVTVRYLPRTHAIRGGLIEVYGAGDPSETFRGNDVNDPPIPVGSVTKRRWTVNRTMTLQDGLALQVRKQIYRPRDGRQAVGEIVGFLEGTAVLVTRGRGGSAAPERPRSG